MIRFAYAALLIVAATPAPAANSVADAAVTLESIKPYGPNRAAILKVSNLSTSPIEEVKIACDGFAESGQPVGIMYSGARAIPAKGEVLAEGYLLDPAITDLKCRITSVR